MATVRVTSKEAKAGPTDFAKLDATTENDIRGHMIETGMDPDQPFEGLRLVVSPAEFASEQACRKTSSRGHSASPH